jgi:effector-binding domain-containing protein
MSFAPPSDLTIMSTESPAGPTIVTRSEQPYVALRGFVTMQTFSAIADRLPGLFGWLQARGIEPTGAPFFKYDVIDMERQLEVEAGVPVAAVVDGDGEVFSGVLPAGRYATVTHVGHPDRLIDVAAAMLEWAARQGLEWDMSETDGGQRWGCRLEILRTNPAEEPDPGRWETELAFRLAD